MLCFVQPRHFATHHNVYSLLVIWIWVIFKQTQSEICQADVSIVDIESIYECIMYVIREVRCKQITGINKCKRIILITFGISIDQTRLMNIEILFQTSNINVHYASCIFINMSPTQSWLFWWYNVWSYNEPLSVNDDKSAHSQWSQ